MDYTERCSSVDAGLSEPSTAVRAASSVAIETINLNRETYEVEFTKLSRKRRG